MGPKLPQDDSAHERREQQLAKRRDEYHYAYDYPVGVATCAELQKADQYSAGFFAKSLHAYIEIGTNLGGMALEGFERGTLLSMVEQKFAGIEPHQLHEHIFQLPKDLAASMPHRWVTSWTDFDELFVTWEKPPVMAWQNTDERRNLAFAWQRIAGFNPMMLQRCTQLPDNFRVSDDAFRQAMGTSDSLGVALAEGRVYLVDYALLDGIEAGVTDGVQKYLSMPLALFAVPRGGGDLHPVAIQAGQKPGADNPIVTPSDGWLWRQAMDLVQVADASVHEAIVHLGRTHLVMEAVTIALKRNLAEVHPLYVLLEPHTEGTMAINHSAKTSLIAPGGVVDRCFSPRIEDLAAAVAKGVGGYELDKTDPIKDLAARGVDDDEHLNTYPYRDDAIPHWNALKTFLGEYVAVYYSSDADVAADSELQGFVRELGAQDGGRLKGVPEAQTIEQLTYLLTRIVFIAGPQHSAVNFAQFPFMGPQANTPGASYQPQYAADTPNQEEPYTKMLPPWRIAIESSTMVYLLSNVRASELGHYGLLHFTDPRVLPVLYRYQAALKQLESDIQGRESTRLMSYPFLRPSQVLQSISI